MTVTHSAFLLSNELQQKLAQHFFFFCTGDTGIWGEGGLKRYMQNSRNLFIVYQLNVIYIML